MPREELFYVSSSASYSAEKGVAESPSDTDANVYDQIAKIIFYALAFLLPVWVLPTNALLAELNKAYLANFLIIIAFISWLVGRVKSGQLVVPKAVFIVLLFIAVLVFGTSAVFSESRHVSFIGLGSETNTFFALLIGCVSAFLASVLFQKGGDVLRWFFVLLASAVTVLIFQTSHSLFNFTPILGRVLDTSTANLVGGWNTFGIFLGLVAFLSLALLEIVTPKSAKAGLLALLAGSLFFLALVNFITLWWILAAFLVVLLSYIFIARRESHVFFSAALFVLFFITFFILAQQLAGNLVAKSGITFYEVRPSWGSTLDIIKHSVNENALLGSGPNTFAYSWMKWKPDSINQTLFWNARFSSGVGLVPSMAADVGVLGVSSILALIGSILFLGLKSFGRLDGSRESYIFVASFFLSIYLWAANIFYTPGFVIFIFTFIVSGLVIAMAARLGIISNFRIAIFQNSAAGFLSVIFTIFVLMLSASGAYWLSQKYVAAYTFGKGLVAFERDGDAAIAEAKMIEAISLDNLDYYNRTLSDVYLLKLQKVITQTDISASDLRAQFQDVLSSAVKYAKAATELNKIDALNWMQLGRVYEAVIPFKVSGAEDMAGTVYDQAAAYNPKSPEPYFVKARVAMQLQDFEKAKELLNKALELKSDYMPARFMMVQAESGLGNLKAAVKQAEDARLLAPNDIGLLFQLGILYHYAGNFEGAREALEQAVMLNPSYANARYFLGLTYDKLGKKPEAIAQFEFVLALNPDQQEIVKILSNLKSGKSALSGIAPPGPSPEKRSELPIK